MTRKGVSWRPVAWMAFAIASLGACDCDEPIQETFARLSATPATVAFGGVAVRTEETRTVTLSSDGSAAVRFDAITFEGPDASAFSVVDAPEPDERLHPGTRRELVVAYAPEAETSHAAVLVIGTNDAASPLRITLEGHGLVPGIRLCHDPGGDVPEEELDCAEVGAPLVLDFGELQAGEEAVRTALVRNVGAARLVIEEVAAEAGTTAAGFEVAEDVVGTRIPRGGGVLLPVRFDAAGQGVAEGRVAIHSNDLEHPVAHVDLVADAVANTPPVACAAAVQTIGIDGRIRDLAEPLDELRVQPRDRVVLTAHPLPDCSFDEEDGDVLRYEWTIVEQPAGETARLNNPTSGPAPGSAAQPPSIDVAGVGVYRVALVVYDSLDTPSSPAEVIVDARPEDDLIVEITWHVGVDLDLHLLAPGVGTVQDRAFCDPLDCFWATCRPTSPGIPALAWGDDDDPETDPLLRFDNLGDTLQPGSESLRLETVSLFRAAAMDPGLGPYYVGVHYFDDRDLVVDDFEVEVTVIHEGEVLYRSTRTFAGDSEGTFWVAGTFDANALAAGADREDLGQPLDGPVFFGTYTPPPPICME